MLSAISRTPRIALLAAVVLVGLVTPIGAQETGQAAAEAFWLEPDTSPVSLEELHQSDLWDAATSQWADPPRLERDGNGVFHLDVRMGKNVIRVDGRDYDVDLRSYNGRLVGPAIRFRAGELLQIHVHNNLPEEREECRGSHRHGNVPACFNLTNLHTHGLHVSPRPPADDIFRVIDPGDDNLYQYPILPLGNPPGEPPGTHYPGTFWYHAHRHGSTAVQLASGMAGPLILEGDIDQYPGVRGTKERIFVFQQLAWDRDGELKSFADILPNWRGCTGDDPACRHGPPKHTSINGRVLPRIEMQLGRVERWRFIDAGVFEMLDMLLVSESGRTVPLHQIAIDGITLEQVTRRTAVRMGPGYRTDLLVLPSAPGRYFLWKRQAPFALAAGELDAATVDNAQVLAVVEVDRDRCTDCPGLLPVGARLPFPAQMLPDITADEVTRRRPLIFSAERPPGQVPIFLVNGEPYRHGHVDHRPVLGTAEQWVLGNSDPGSTRPQAHPFHIHVNAFQMLDAEGRPGEWRDTVIVPPGFPRRWLRMRTRYERFDGPFVLHCHILTHEDLGMMQGVEIVKTRPENHSEEPAR